MSDLLNGEWRLTYPGTSYRFGTPANAAWNLTTPDVGDADLRVADVDRPRQDGRAFGVDYRGGRTISFEMGLRAQTPAKAREEAALLQQARRADAIRSVPGAVAELRTVYDGRERLMYGRPRRLALDYGDVTVNQYVGVVADFACSDDLFYGSVEEDARVSLVPSLGGGLMAPLRSPLSTTASSDRSVGINVDSEMPVWPVVRVNGPVSNAEVYVGDLFRWQLRLSLDYDEYVDIDTRPWARYALRNGSANVTGAIRGTRLARSSIPSGSYPVGFKGEDPTGTSSIEVSWRPTFSSL
jgi:hypothetical protein